MRSNPIRVLTLVVLSFAWMPRASDSHAAEESLHYSVTDVASFRESTDLVKVIDVNDRGDVLFNVEQDEKTIPIVYRSGEAPLRPDVGEGGGQGLALNNKGEVAGEKLAKSADGKAVSKAVLWHDGTTTDLAVEEPDSSAVALNDEGAIVLSIGDSKGREIWRGGSTNPVNFTASDINNLGQLAGNVSPPADNAGEAALPHAAMYDNGELTDLGTLGGDASTALDISDAGFVIGASTISSDGRLFDDGTRAFRWHEGEMTILPPLNEADPAEWDVAYAVNNDGVAVGRSSIVPNDTDQIFESSVVNDYVGANSSAVVWIDGRIFNLNDLIPAEEGLYLTTANGINNRGVVAASGVDQDGYTWAVLLTPTDPTAPTTGAGTDGAIHLGADDVESCGPSHRLPPGLERQWQYDTAGNAQITPTDDAIYISSWVTEGFAPDMHGVAVASLDPATGQELWRVVLESDGIPRDDESEQYMPFELPPGPHSTRPIVQDGLVAIGSHDGVIHALDAATGQVKWTQAFPVVDSFSGVWIDGGVVVAMAQLQTLVDWKLIALNAEFGTSIWQKEFPVHIRSFPVVDSGVFVVEPVVPGTRSFELGDIVAFDIQTGAQHWNIPETELFLRDANYGLLAAYSGSNENGGVLNSGESLATVSLLDIETGREVWTAQVPGNLESSTIAEDAVFVATSESNEGPGFVQAHDAKSGAELWCHQTRSGLADVLTVGDRLVVREGFRTTHVYDSATGQELQRGPVTTDAGSNFGNPAAFTASSDFVVASESAFGTGDEVQPATVVAYRLTATDEDDS